MDATRLQTAKLQELLASIYLSSGERNNYFDAPEESAKVYGLQPATFNQICGTQRESIDFYAKSLKRKRFQEIVQFIPITKRYWKDALKTTFDNYSEKWIPSGPKKHIADLIGFSNYLVNENLLSTEAKDRLRFELMPWDINFKLEEKEYTYKGSHARVKIIEAHRHVGFNFKTIFYQTRFSDLQSFNKKPMKRSNIRSMGIYLKLPYVSKSLEWYLPLPRIEIAKKIKRPNSQI